MARFSFNQRYLDSNGDPLSGGKCYTYEPGTTTNKATYSDAAQTTANTNPVILDANGIIPDIFFSGSIKLVIKDSNDVQINVIDPVGGDSLTSAEVKVLYEDNPDTNAFTDADHTKLDSVESGADVTDEANVTDALDGATLTDITPASDDKVLLQDTSDSDTLKTADAGDFGTNPVYDYTTLADNEYVGATIDMVANGTVNQHNPLRRSGAGNDRHVNMCTGQSTEAITTCMGFGTNSSGVTSGGTVTVLTNGYIRVDDWNWTPGAPVYVNSAGAYGYLSETRPTGSGNWVCRVGIAMTADILYVNPQAPVEIP